jgi:aryl-alcohol dehydrogenase-like predicted oxidoreductase
LRRAVELGINLIDTADSYGPFVSERLIAEALYPYPDDLVIATKGGLTRSGPNQWSPDGRPQHLRAACEGSLQRLRLEQIPLYQFHRVDPAVPLEESLGMLVTLKDEGKIRHIGVCNVDDDQLSRALAITPIVSVQNRYGHADRSSEAILDRCGLEALAFLPWAPLGGGRITDATVERIGVSHDATARQVVLAWLLARSPVMVPIPGTSSVAHLEENVAAAELRLTPQEIAELNRM